MSSNYYDIFNKSTTHATKDPSHLAKLNASETSALLANDVQSVSTIIELSLSCEKLPNCDTITLSDPQVFVYLINNDSKIEIGRTEMILDNLNPRFAKKILMHYHFEQVQRLRFEVVDIDPIGGNDFLGYHETTLADIVADKSAVYKRPLVGGPKRKKPGYIIVDVEELTTCKQVATFNLSAQDLPPTFCGLLNPSASLHIYRSNENGSQTIVHRSAEPIRRTCNPHFKPLQLKLLTLCNGDLDRSIRFELIDQRLDMSRNLGFFETTINSLKGQSGRPNESQVFSLIKASGYSSTGQTQASKLVVSNFNIINQATFLDYIRVGCQIHFMIAIDFTASNGDPAYSDSLHFLDPMRLKINPYEAALSAVGKIIEPYDTVGLFAGFGFGAKLNGPNMPPSHLFPLNGNDQHPYLNSLDQLIQAYKTKIQTVILSGPTNFAPCIQHCNNIAEQFDDGDHYFVLLIVTDGIISDLAQTKRAIIEASRSPMSIIICGVGNADFTAMNELDSDDVVMQIDGKTAERDIVQFVPMNQFIKEGRGINHNTRSGQQSRYSVEAQRLLAEETLREIPDQLTGYMLSRGFHPELVHYPLSCATK